MKKTIVSVLVLLTFALFGVSAATEGASSLNLTTKVAQIDPTWKVYSGKSPTTGTLLATNATIPVSITDSEGVTDVALSFTYTSNINNNYTNLNYKINVAATSFSADGSNDTVPVTLTDTWTSANKSTSTAETPASVNLTGTYQTGLKTDVHAELLAVTWTINPSLTAGDYESTITITYSAI
ncbi:MAG: hypothetical protein ACOX6K_07240 [Sphaerochaetaceae bacterium]|jgi:hypothetical protein